MLINGMYRNKIYDCKTKPESPTAQDTTDQTQREFFFPVKLIAFFFLLINIGNRIASSERIQISKVTLAITVVLGY